MPTVQRPRQIDNGDAQGAGRISAEDARQYGDVAAIYDALMAGVPHSAWLTRIERAARVRGKNPLSALEVACGTGIVSQLLARRGYRPVVGVDIAPAMIAIARTKAEAAGPPVSSVRFEVQDATRLDLGGHTFDLVVSLFDSLNYIVEPSDLRTAFVRIFAHTAPGGLFAFDLNSLYALSHDLFTQASFVGPLRHSWRSTWDRETRLCRVDMAFAVTDEETGEVREFQEIHVQRAYTTTEIRQFVSEAGFTDLEVFGNYGERGPSPNSDRLLFVCERPAE